MMETTFPVVDSLDAQKIRYIEVDGLRTRYYEDGTGDPLVLFNGGQFGSFYSLDCWSLNLPELAAHFHVYAVDKLGQGCTDNPKSASDYTFEVLLRHSHAVLQALGVTGAHLVGHSRGALLVACLALERPELAKTVVIVDSSTLAPEDPEVPSGGFYEEIARRTPPGPPTRETVRMEPDAQAYSARHISDDFVRRMHEIGLLPRTAEARQRMAALGQSVWFPSLNRKRQETLRMIDERGLPVPTLVIWGFNDKSAPLPLGFRLLARICAKTRQTEMHVLNEAGHYSFREQYQAFNRAVKSFCLG